VVIPTRNRADVLIQAIRCALAQHHDDFEVVVSDNSSADATPEVVKSFDDRRIRYFRTPKLLHMPDSWEFALSHASGRYVTFVSDDDGVAPRLLPTIEDSLKRSNLEIVAWPFGAVYHHETSDDKEQRNTLAFQRVDGRSETVRKEEILADLSQVSFTQKLPRLINSCASREVLADVRKRFGRVFFPVCPDYSAGVAQLAVRPALAFLNDLLLIWGVCNDSIGYSANKGSAAAQTFFAELKAAKVDRAQHVPIQVKSTMNVAMDSVLNIKAISPQGLERLDVNWKAYFLVVGNEMLALERNGADMESAFADMRAALRGQPLLTQLTVFGKILPLRNAAHFRLIQSRIRDQIAAIKQPIRKQLGMPASPYVRVSGHEGGFSNMFEAAGRLDDLICPKQQRRW
jgi:hypothetical protein